MNNFFQRLQLSFLSFCLLCVSVVFIIPLQPLYGETTFNSDDSFLEKIEKDTFNYFLHVMNPETGLVKDNSRKNSPCNVAGIGFSLTALCIGQERGWIEPEHAKELVLKILMFMYDKVAHKEGFFYHFISTKTGQRVWNSEYSSIDTALFLAGALTAAEYYGGDIQVLAYELFDRVNWDWMRNKSDFLSMGWTPEQEFLRYYWDRYAEHMILYALAIGSDTHPINQKYWYRWQRDIKSYDNYSLVSCGTGSLFTYQYAHAWIDFRFIDDKNTDWWVNSIDATKANREFCLNNQQEFKSYNENSWGLTACIGPRGYKAYGAEPGYYPLNDGTIAPCAAAGSIVFTPEESITALKYMYNTFGSHLYGQYGFKDAYNVDEKWFADQSITINQGIILVMIENYRSGFVWKTFMKNKYIQNWIKRCDLNTSEKTSEHAALFSYELEENTPTSSLEMHRDSEVKRCKETQLSTYKY